MDIRSPLRIAEEPGHDREHGAASAHVYREFGLTVVCVHGEIDISTVHILETVLGVLSASPGDDVAVDLAKTSFIETSGLRVLLEAEARLAGCGRRLTVRRPRRGVRRLFTALSSDHLLAA